MLYAPLEREEEEERFANCGWACEFPRKLLFSVLGCLGILIFIVFTLWCAYIQGEKYKRAERETREYQQRLRQLQIQAENSDLSEREGILSA